MQRILAGDIGGTKTNLALYETSGGSRLTLTREATFKSQENPGLIDILAAFLAPETGGSSHPLPAGLISAAVFGIAGPVIDGAVVVTNLPWLVDDKALATYLQTPHVRLMNDLETTAFGILHLPADQFQVLNPGVARRGNRAVIAAGTGLGQAFLHWDGSRFRPSATEGGHADFAPRTDQEVALLNHLRDRFGRHVSYERILSGPGLLNVFEFLVDVEHMKVEPAIEEKMKIEDPSAVIGQAGVEGSCHACVEALKLFVSIYGAQAGNLALATMALGGVYVGGGIVTKILPRMGDGAFMKAFTDKGRTSGLLSEVPVKIVLNAKASLVGAAEMAAGLL